MESACTPLNHLFKLKDARKYEKLCFKLFHGFTVSRFHGPQFSKVSHRHHRLSSRGLDCVDRLLLVDSSESDGLTALHLATIGGVCTAHVSHVSHVSHVQKFVTVCRSVICFSVFWFVLSPCHQHMAYRCF